MLSVRETRKSTIEAHWRVPRTMDKGGIFYDALSTTNSTTSNRKEIKEIFQNINHPMLMDSLNENAYRVLHSGYWIGENKCNKKRGDKSVCQVCNKVETIRHMYCDCHKINSFWKKLLSWWESRTSESLNNNARTVILGLRHNNLYNKETSFPETSLPFSYLRAIAYSIIRKERAKLQKGIKDSTPEEMFRNTLQTLQLRANMLYLNAKKWEKWNRHNDKEVEKRDSIYSMRSFCESWEDSGLVKLTGSHSLPVLIRARGH